MCDPVSAMIGLQLAGTAVSAAGQIAQGKNAELMGNLQQQAYNQQADAVGKASTFEQMQERRKQELAQSNARAQVGASGVGFAGSPTEVLAANAGQNELDIAAIQYGSTLKQSQLRTQGAIAAYQGQQGKQAGYIGALGTTISGLGKAVQIGVSPFNRSGGSGGRSGGGLFD
jgi:hypothetical protein